MLNIGDILDGKYKIEKVLGQGGMGTVYLCENIRLHNMWAIKEITMDLNDDANFPAEIEILKGLKHPYIPRIVDMFHEDGKAYIVEDYIEGENIESIIKRTGSMKSDKVCEVALELCDIIEYLHDLNPPVIYRDLKPSNIILTPEGKAVLVDFSISRIYKYSKESDTVVMGSKGYAAPEQYGASQSGKQTDIYGLGATMYFMLTGKIPSGAADLESTGMKDIIMKAMDSDMNERYQSINEMRMAIHSKTESAAKTKVLSNEPMGLQRTAVLDGSMGKRALVRKRKKTGIILAGVLIFFALVFGAEYLLWGSKKAEPVVSKNNVSTTKDTTASSGSIKEPPTPPPAQDIDIHGIINSNSPIVIGSNNEGKGKSKGKHGSNQVQDIYYKVNPSARAGRFNNKFTIEVDSLEFLGDMAYVYFIVNNSTGSNIEVPLKNMYLNSGAEDNKKAIANETLKIPDGTLSSKIKIPFQHFELTDGTIKLYTDVSSTESSNDSNIELTIDVK